MIYFKMFQPTWLFLVASGQEHVVAWGMVALAGGTWESPCLAMPAAAREEHKHS